VVMRGEEMGRELFAVLCIALLGFFFLFDVNYSLTLNHVFIDLLICLFVCVCVCVCQTILIFAH
jgi:hypothetical protein